MICPACETWPKDDEWRFCPYCGEQLITFKAFEAGKQDDRDDLDMRDKQLEGGE